MFELIIERNATFDTLRDEHRNLFRFRQSICLKIKQFIFSHADNIVLKHISTHAQREITPTRYGEFIERKLSSEEGNLCFV